MDLRILVLIGDHVVVEPRHPAAAETTSAPDRSATPAHLATLGTLCPDHSLTHCVGKKKAMRVGASPVSVGFGGSGSNSHGFFLS
jgi:hypothetical protein